MRTIVAGSRYLTNSDIIEEGIAASGFAITEVVSGGARGTDFLGEQWAKKNGIACSVFPADWDRYGKSAGPIRNAQMANHAEALIAFPAKDSVGTYDMIRKAKKKGLQVFVVNIEKSTKPYDIATGLSDWLRGLE